MWWNCNKYVSYGFSLSRVCIIFIVTYIKCDQHSISKTADWFDWIVFIILNFFWITSVIKLFLQSHKREEPICAFERVKFLWIVQFFTHLKKLSKEEEEKKVLKFPCWNPETTTNDKCVKYKIYKSLFAEWFMWIK